MQAAREKLAKAVAGLTELASAEQLLPKRKELEMFCKDLRSVAGCDPTQEALGAKLAEDLPPVCRQKVTGPQKQKRI